MKEPPPPEMAVINDLIPVKVYIDENNQISLDGDPVSLTTLPIRIETLKAFNPDLAILVVAHENANFNPVVQIKDSLSRFGNSAQINIRRSVD